MDLIHNIFSAHSHLSPTARKAWSISRKLFKEKCFSPKDIDTLISLDSESIAPFRMALASDGYRHGSSRREQIVDAISHTTIAKQHRSTTIALLASFVDDQEGMVGAKAVEQLANYGPQAEGVLRKALSHGNRWARSFATKALGNLGGIRAVPDLIAALQDPDERVRSDAAEALGKLGDSQATQPLFGALTDPNWLVRESASSALATFSNQEMVEKLAHFLHDRDHHIRAQAVRTLANIDSDSVFPALISALEDPHFEVQWDAIDALATTNNSAAIAPLLSHYHQGDKALRQRITKACQAIGLNHVAAQLTHNDSSVRIAAAELIGQQSETERLAELTQAWFHESNEDAQMWIVIGLGRLAAIAGESCPNDAIHALTDATKSPHRSVRYHASKAMESLKHPLAESFAKQATQQITIAINCPNCLHPMRLTPPLTGKQRHCPQCHLTFTMRQGAEGNLIVAPSTATTPPVTPLSDHWFDILQVKPDADADTIQQAFRALLKQYHPDKVSGLGAELQHLAEEKTRQLTQALRRGLEACKRR